MSDETPNAKQKKTRTRSPGYPTTNLQDALEKARIVFEKDGRHETAIESLAAHWGYKANSSSAGQLAAALKKFGLFESSDKDGYVKLTDPAVRIIADDDPNSQTKAELIKRAALSPKIYALLWEKYGGLPPLPSDAAIRPYLVADLGFNPNAVEEFTKNFRATIEFAKLSPGDKLEANDREPNLFSVEKTEEPVGMTAPAKPEPLAPAPSQTRPPGIKEMRFELDSGPIVIRYPMSQEDFDLLLKSLDLWKKKLVVPTKGETA
jgi:hypothetical protein